MAAKCAVGGARPIAKTRSGGARGGEKRLAKAAWILHETGMKNTPARSTFLAITCGLALAGTAFSQTDAPDKAQTLLAKVKRSDIDRQVTAKQTGLNRMAEDLAKGQKEAEAMQASIEATGGLLKESGENLSQLQSQKKRLEQVLELTALRIEAERLKSDGLKMLSEAQTKAKAALAKRAEETDLRASLGAAELKQLTPESAEPAAEPAVKDAGSKDAGARTRAAHAELRKKLATSENSAANAEMVAREAMRAASTRLEQAEIASVKVKRKASTVESDLPAIAEKPLDLDEKPAAKPEKK